MRGKDNNDESRKASFAAYTNIIIGREKIGLIAGIRRSPGKPYFATTRV